LARGAEAAVQRTSRLGRDTQGAAAVLRDVYGFDAAARCHTHHPLARAILGNIFADHFRTANLGAGLELVAQGLADIGHVIEIVDTEVMDPLHDLPGTKALLPELFRSEERRVGKGCGPG